MPVVRWTSRSASDGSIALVSALIRPELIPRMITYGCSSGLLKARAERYAKARRMPVSGLVMAALEAYLDDVDDER
jgi:hypothetical protein